MKTKINKGLYFTTFAILLFVIILIGGVIFLFSTQIAAKTIGGTSTIKLEQGERLIHITWKENDLWLLTKKDENQEPTKYEFKENSVLGVVEGKVIIIEK